MKLLSAWRAHHKQLTTSPLWPFIGAVSIVGWTSGAYGHGGLAFFGPTFCWIAVAIIVLDSLLKD